MPRVQQIEAAIGEADAQVAPFGEPLVEHQPVENDLLLRCERSGGKNARAQLRGGDRRGAALADYYCGSRIGRTHRGLVACLGRQQHRERRNHGIACTRRVPQLDSVGGHVNRGALRGHQDQAGVAERNDDSVGSQ